MRLLLFGILCSVAPNVMAFLKAPPTHSTRRALSASWKDLESMLPSVDNLPVNIDSCLQPDSIYLSTERPTLFRERHGWCPYSERVWLTCELKDMQYDTVRIDNTGHGPRPSYFSGTTPQVQWPSGSRQGESLDLVRDMDALQTPVLRFHHDDVQDSIGQFSSIFPRARPSSRAAFLFQYNGDPLWKSVFEETLQKTNDLLASREGSFFCGDTLSAADVAWAPFLERYRYQLPCLHQGLEPCSSRYPALEAWYKAMDQVPAYACRVKGDRSSWRKVLTMAGFGNAGVPPDIQTNMDELVEKELADTVIDQALWEEYASTRPYVAATPQAEAAAVIVRNRKQIIADILKRSSKDLPTTESGLDEALNALALVLMENDEDAKSTPGVGALASFLDERMCVPRDMGAMSAASVKQLA